MKVNPILSVGSVGRHYQLRGRIDGEIDKIRWAERPASSYMYLGIIHTSTVGPSLWSPVVGSRYVWVNSLVPLHSGEQTACSGVPGRAKKVINSKVPRQHVGDPYKRSVREAYLPRRSNLAGIKLTEARHGACEKSYLDNRPPSVASGVQ